MGNTNSTVKVTIADKYNALINYFNNASDDDVEFDFDFDVVEFLADRLEKSQKKSTSKADKEKAELNSSIADTIVKVLTEQGSMRNSDLTKAVNKVMESDFQPQKISNIVKQLKDNGKVTRTEVKKVAYFSV